MLLSIITPTYNRATLLPQCYKSLCTQTCFDFEWIIIDDGSTDNTESVVRNFNSNQFPIIYKKKENGGKHTALNASHQYIHGECVLILDSDDYLLEDAVETVLCDWKKFILSNEIAGINYYRVYENGNIISKRFREDYYISDNISYRINKNIKGDQCETIRADIFKEFIFPVYENEKFASEGFLWNYMGFRYKTVFRDKGIYACEYIPGGLTDGGRKLLMSNPKAMIDHAKTFFDDRVCLRVRLKETLLYIVYSCCDKRSIKQMINESGNKTMVVFQLPFGLILFKYWKHKYF